jgi:nucleotide-binding universal stress UspA family protein
MKKKLIWFSFDPFQKDIKSQAKALKITNLYAKAMSAVIQPVYFADRYRGTDAGSYLFPLFPTIEAITLSELEEIVHEKWNNLARSLKIKSQPLRILTHKSSDVPSLDSKARTLANEAKKAKVEFIAIQTKASSGVKRLVMGSFAETFLLNSSVPTLLIPPISYDLKKPKKMLYSSDLSATSLLAFKKICPIIKDLKLKIILLYNLEIPQSLLQILKPSTRRLIDTAKLIEQARPDLEFKAKDFIDIAKTFGIAIKFEICADASVTSKSEIILKRADFYRIDCIALASQSGEAVTSILGATSRSIVRTANRPVLIHRVEK